MIKSKKSVGDDEMKLKNITVQVGGFHDHWLRNGTENPTLLMAAMEYLNYDFILSRYSWKKMFKYNKNRQLILYSHDHNTIEDAFYEGGFVIL